jgi:hypothetical protein
LAAATLSLGKDHLVTQALEHSNDRPGNIRIKLVDEAGDKKRDAHEGTLNDEMKK